MSNGTLSAITDEELDARLQSLRHSERETTLEILFHLNEVERRRLHLRRGYSSLFVYCTEYLRYSESAAGRRVQAARCVARFPRVAALLKSGDVNLSTLGLVACLLTEKNAEELLERIRGRSQREVEKIASGFRPPLRLHDRVQRVNVPAPLSPGPPPAVASTAAPQSVAVSSLFVNSVSNSRSGSEKSLNSVETVPKLHIQFLADDAFMQKYNEVCALLSHRIPKSTFAAVFGALLEEFLTRHSPKKKQERRERRIVETKTPAAAPTRSTSPLAAISTPTRDAVFVRDQGRCTYVGSNGRRCSETHGLHIDHITPRARNGSNDANNLRLLCARHNQLEAVRILGEDWMSRYRRPHASG